MDLNVLETNINELEMELNGLKRTWMNSKTNLNLFKMDFNGLETAEIALVSIETSYSKKKREWNVPEKIQNEQQWFEKQPGQTATDSKET